MNCRSIAWLVALSLVCAFNAAAAAADNALTPSELRSGWKLLFDGQTLDGWRTFQKQGLSDGWIVENGILTLAKPGAGDIVTREQYDNFELSIEYRISPGGNSGIMFHVTEDVAPSGVSGPEVQVFDNAHDPNQQQAGWLYGLYRPPVNKETGKLLDATHPAGEWNQVQLLVTKNICKVNVNGVQYYQFKKGSPEWDELVAKSKFVKYPQYGKATKGFICLQDHGNIVSYRNIKLRELPSDGAAPEPVGGQLEKN